LMPKSEAPLSSLAEMSMVTKCSAYCKNIVQSPIDTIDWSFSHLKSNPMESLPRQSFSFEVQLWTRYPSPAAVQSKKVSVQPYHRSNLSRVLNKVSVGNHVTVLQLVRGPSARLGSALGIYNPVEQTGLCV
jgi:hypothetical protein